MHYWGERSKPHTCGENGKLSISIYVCMVCAYSVYTFCPICAQCNISTLHISRVASHSVLLKRREKTEWLNSTVRGTDATGIEKW